MENNTYQLIVDSTNPQAAISAIKERTKEDVLNEFMSSLNPDGSVPHGLISRVAKKYGYTNAGISRILNAQGYTRKNVINL